MVGGAGGAGWPSEEEGAAPAWEDARTLGQNQPEPDLEVARALASALEIADATAVLTAVTDALEEAVPAGAEKPVEASLVLLGPEQALLPG